jgi:hypothetical protein
VDASVRDVQTFVDHIAKTYGVAVEDMAVVAQSVGAVLAAIWAHDYAPKIRAMVLASPAFVVKLYVPFARPGLRLLHRLLGDFAVNSYVKARLLTHDPARQASYDTDPFITRPISVNMLLGLHDTAERVIADARAITVPTQLLISGSDYVVRHGPQHRFFETLGSPLKERHVLPGFFHDTLGERDRAPAVAQARAFLESRFAEPPPDGREILQAHRTGYTRDEADRLATPLSMTSPQGAAWGLVRLGLKVGGLVSEGIRLGHRTGFDSGSTLDYVYRNEAKGLGPGGRLVDRAYLNAIGWRGIRHRKLHVEELIRLGLERLKAAGLPVHVLDVAAGHGATCSMLSRAAVCDLSLFFYATTVCSMWRPAPDSSWSVGSQTQSASSKVTPSMRRRSPGSSPGRPSPWSQGSTNSSPTMVRCPAPSRVWDGWCHREAVSSTRASPGTRSSPSSRAL